MFHPCPTQVQQSTDVSPGSLEDLDCPLYGGEVWVMWGADSGGGTTKFTVQFAGNDVHMAGMYCATDVHVNMEAFMRKGEDWLEQLEVLVRRGVEVKDRVTGEVRRRKVQLFLCGDMMYQCEAMGHQGCASTFPCLRCTVTSQHLRRNHLPGTEEFVGATCSPSIPACRAATVDRTVDSFDAAYMDNVVDRRQGGDHRKNGHHHHSIIARCVHGVWCVGMWCGVVWCWLLIVVVCCGVLWDVVVW